MDTYLTISEALRITQVPEKLLNELASSSKIRTIILSTGERLLNADDALSRIKITMRPEFKKYSHLQGNLIWATEASRRYDVSQQTISRWIQRGYISKQGQKGRRVLIDEAEIATYADIYHTNGGAQGRWVFVDGSVYRHKVK